MKEIGIIGLGVMGRNLAMNMLDNGIKVSVFNRHSPPHEIGIAKIFASQFPDSEGFDNVSLFINSLEKPRKILLMVNAGEAVDNVINLLKPFLEMDDLIMDGGNSHYTDTARRMADLKSSGIFFLGIGISGGEEGARHGASIMPGGSLEAYKMVAPFFEKIAAIDASGKPCCNYIGPGGSGHFVKMVHNGIEYAEMQILAEIYHIMKNLMDLSPINISDTFDLWLTEGLRSYLLEITRNILLKKEGPDFLIDKILDAAAQKGTGGWSGQTAIEMGICLNTISESVFARILSGMKKERTIASKLYPVTEKTPSLQPTFRQLKNGYQAARVINHHLGFEMLSKASEHEQWGLDLPEIARLWTNGCIIRSELIEKLSRTKTYTPILMQEEVIENLKLGWKELSYIVSAGLQDGLAVPVLSAALNYFLGYTTANSPANIIQAQRDYFGAHTYKRNDQQEELNFHTDWQK